MDVKDRTTVSSPNSSTIENSDNNRGSPILVTMVVQQNEQNEKQHQKFLLNSIKNNVDNGDIDGNDSFSKTKRDSDQQRLIITPTSNSRRKFTVTPSTSLLPGDSSEENVTTVSSPLSATMNSSVVSNTLSSSSPRLISSTSAQSTTGTSKGIQKPKSLLIPAIQTTPTSEESSSFLTGNNECHHFPQRLYCHHYNKFCNEPHFHQNYQCNLQYANPVAARFDSVNTPSNEMMFSQSDAIHQTNLSENSQSTTPSMMMIPTMTTTSNSLMGVGGTLSAGIPTVPITSSPISSINPALAVRLRPRLHNSLRSVVSAHIPGEGERRSSPQGTLISPPMANRMLRTTSSYIFSDAQSAKFIPDATSIRSLASIGVGSTDGRKLVIKRVPNSPTELFNIMTPMSTGPAGIDDDDDDDDSFGDITDDSDMHNLKPRRQHWANKMQFVLACIGYSVGLGNVWRFPYMCYRSGGGVFLVPYFIILVICSVPMLYMELAVGQYTGRGPIGALGQICPLFKGAGVASVVVSFLMSTYYSVIIAYAIYYFFTSFKPIMPWTDCNNRWNTPDCWVPHRREVNMTPSDLSRTPSEEFFENKVLQISHGIEYPGNMRWELFACLIFAWMLVYFALWKSIKSSGKVRYFTATFPFVLIVVFMGRALTLEGAEDGLRYFFRPKWEELRNANVWINAASQSFNSLGIAFGSMICFASYNKYNNNILHDTLAVSIVNAVTSILVGVFSFATLGNLAFEQNTDVRNVISDGPGFIFIVYPQALAKMPAGQMWAVMFFFMLLCLGLNSQFAIVEVVVTSIQDGYPNWIKRKLVYHEILVLIICVISFLFGLPNLIQGGIYFFQLMDHYAASISIMFLAFFQVIAIAWFYGTERLSKNVKQMTGKAPSLYLRSCWLICTPMFLISLWILSLINYREPTYHNGSYHYPEWAYAIGWIIASISLICIPSYAIVNIFRAEGESFCDKFHNAVKPNIYECKICGEHHCEHDFPEDQYMLPPCQEMTPIIQPRIILKPPPGRDVNRVDDDTTYSDHIEQQRQQEHILSSIITTENSNAKQQGSNNEDSVITTTATTATSSPPTKS